jgi:ADP-ribosylglycohydrolase
MTFPPDYEQRVYAGVLGKIIGVYLGRPFEQWKHEDILSKLGEIRYYVHERRGVPLVVADDDISGTFTFIRALEDYGFDPDITPKQIGQTWLNYLIENRTVLWWGGMSNSTEHTAYLRLKRGIDAPRSGAIETNGRVVAEQIGAQIFIDGWGMVCPGDPARAADYARRAGSVSHDGEAIYGAQVVAAIEAQAFVERDLGKLIDIAVGFIPADSTIRRVIDDLRAVRARSDDWHDGLSIIRERYGYDRWPGGCHMVPNHAVVMLGLLWGNGDFQQAMLVTNTAGYDTDCNAANVGCILGIQNGLAGLDAPGQPDWRGPVADRMLLPTADGGNFANDAARVAQWLVNVARRSNRRDPWLPKGGARYPFALPGSVHGFVEDPSPESRGVLNIRNAANDGRGALELTYRRLSPGRFARAATATFATFEQMKLAGSYGVHASPSLYPGQRVEATVAADAQNAQPVTARLYLRHYNEKDELTLVHGPATTLRAGASAELAWLTPDTDGQPIAEIGVELTGIGDGAVHVDRVNWSGVPACTLKRPAAGGSVWMKAWVDGIDQRMPWALDEACQNEGTGLAIQGCRDWRDYRIETTLRPATAKRVGLAIRVQGMRRWYGLLLNRDGTATLVKCLDGETVLAAQPYAWEPYREHAVHLEAHGNRLRGWVNGQALFDVIDAHHPLDGGAVAMVVEEGKLAHGPVRIVPLPGSQ